MYHLHYCGSCQRYWRCFDPCAQELRLSVKTCEHCSEAGPGEFVILAAPAISGNLVDSLRDILSPPERKGAFALAAIAKAKGGA